jgi:hypothetical protein
LMEAAERVVKIRNEPSLKLVGKSSPHNSHTDPSISATQSSEVLESMVVMGGLEPPTSAL